MSSSEIEEDLLIPSTSSSAESSTHRKPVLHRFDTAPALIGIPNLLPSSSSSSSSSKPNFGSAGSILKHSCVLLLVYLFVGVLVYYFNSQSFSGVETHPAIDGFYFCIVTFCTIGYGDIHPLTPATKAFCCVFVLVGFGLIDVMLSNAINYMLDVLENMIRANARARDGASSCIFDAETERMQIRKKVASAIGVLLFCIGAGTLALYLIEDLDWMDSVYLSVMSVTTVGYGDQAFNTMPGRIFASFWLFGSTLAAARAVLYLAEASIDKHRRRIANWVLQRDFTVDDLCDADLNRKGFISKPEFVIYKLKEMGKIGDRDILPIYNQFRKLDPNNVGKITRLDLARDA